MFLVNSLILCFSLKFLGALLTWKICCTFILPEHSSIVANNQNSDGLAINIEPIDQAELNRLEG